MSRRLMMILAVMAAASPFLARGGDDSTKLAEKLQGEWVGVEVEIQGKKLTEEDAKAVRVSYKGDEVTVRTGGPDRPGRNSTLKRLDPAKSPMEMDLLALEREEKGMTQHLIFSIDKDRLRLCGPIKGEKRPSEFKTMEKDGFFLFTLKRIDSKNK